MNKKSFKKREKYFLDAWHWPFTGLRKTFVLRLVFLRQFAHIYLFVYVFNRKQSFQIIKNPKCVGKSQNIKASKDRLSVSS